MSVLYIVLFFYYFLLLLSFILFVCLCVFFVVGCCNFFLANQQNTRMSVFITPSFTIRQISDKLEFSNFFEPNGWMTAPEQGGSVQTKHKGGLCWHDKGWTKNGYKKLKSFKTIISTPSTSFNDSSEWASERTTDEGGGWWFVRLLPFRSFILCILFCHRADVKEWQTGWLTDYPGMCARVWNIYLSFYMQIQQRTSNRYKWQVWMLWQVFEAHDRGWCCNLYKQWHFNGFSSHKLWKKNTCQISS